MYIYMFSIYKYKYIYIYIYIYIHSIKLCFDVFNESNFLSLALKIIENTSSALKFGQRSSQWPPLEGVMHCCMCYWMKWNTKCKRRRCQTICDWFFEMSSNYSLLSDLSGCHSSYGIDKGKENGGLVVSTKFVIVLETRKLRTRGHYLIGFCFVYTAQFLNITTFRKPDPSSVQHSGSLIKQWPFLYRTAGHSLSSDQFCTAQRGTH